jgi:TonB family protein
MRNYLILSSSAHFLLLAVFFFLARNSFTMTKHQNYYIDFIGQGRVVTMADATAAPGSESRAAEPSKAAKIRAEKPKEDPFSTSGDSEPLPPPSVLGGAARLIEPQTADKSGEGDGSPVLADFSNFPYPWYITQVREALWNSWTQRMPSSGMLKCTVRFDIQRGGTVGSVSVESSSGNRLFDYAAETAVESSAPFPGLPDDFYEDTLTVHVEFKTTD